MSEVEMVAPTKAEYEMWTESRDYHSLAIGALKDLFITRQQRDDALELAQQFRELAARREGDLKSLIAAHGRVEKLRSEHEALQEKLMDEGPACITCNGAGWYFDGNKDISCKACKGCGFFESEEKAK